MIMGEIQAKIYNICAHYVHYYDIIHCYEVQYYKSTLKLISSNNKTEDPSVPAAGNKERTKFPKV